VVALPTHTGEPLFFLLMLLTYYNVSMMSTAWAISETYSGSGTHN